jgi:RNA ligase
MTAPHLDDIFPIEELEVAITSGYVSATSHPTLPLTIYNYTPAAMYERFWNDVTVNCRGLIADGDGNIVARPFAKFFNYGETDQYGDLPAGDPIVTEKMDGSLGIIYTYNGETAVATRGSFTSDQSIWATQCLQEDYFSQPDGVTTLVEIVYPANRIVVDYGDRHTLVLLGAVDNATGADIPLSKIDWWDGDVAASVWMNTIDDLVLDVQDPEGFWHSREGVVLCWPQPNAPSFRLKIKHPRYVELHRIVTGLSTRTIHEALATDTLVDLIASVPDEFYPWVQQVADDLYEQYNEIYWQVRNDLNAARLYADNLADRIFRDFDTDQPYSRKDLARHITENAKYPGLCFAMEDDKNMPEKIWPLLVPERKTAIILEEAE